MTRLDLVVFGATGFTGHYTVEEMVRLQAKKGPFTWGVAGRNKGKLETLLTDVGKKLACDLKDIPVIVADVSDESSLKNMASKAKVVLNCCGPYRFFGEPVVKACIASKTHHVDVSGEPQYMERMQLDYHEAAKKNGVYVVSACGFDSIPADLGLVHLTKEFGGQVNSVETYLESWVPGNVRSTAGLHYGTWESAVYGLAHAKELGPVRRKLYPERLPAMTPKLAPRFPIHKNELVNRWCLPFPGSDRSVLQRSQRWFFEKEKQRPVQVQTYVAMPNFLATMVVVVMGIIFNVLTKFEVGRTLLLAYPRLFSLGFASHEGPSEGQARNTHFSITFFGSGWSETSAEPTDKHANPPNRSIVTKVSGTNPGYGATCVILIMSALTILREADKMPETGGVYPPGAAFAKTSIIKGLNEHGVKFEVISEAK